ncbi:MAG TPA: gluconokinase [Gemmatimonadales bacterium]|nr:gluconokinase [Gemmatimonadales bacterium]
MGVAGVGKTLVGSLLAGALGVPFVEGDQLHPPANVAKMARGIPLTDADRLPWLETIAARIAAARRSDTGIVVSCSALKRAYRDILRAADPELQFVHLTGDRALIARRLATRTGHFMPASLLDSQLATLEVPASDERAWTFDLADPAESIVSQIMRQLEETPSR